MSSNQFSSRDSCLTPTKGEKPLSQEAGARLLEEWVHSAEKEQRQPPSVRQLQWKHDVEVTESKGRYQYRLPGDSTRKVLFETEASDSGVKQGAQLLQAAVDTKRRHLEQKN